MLEQITGEVVKDDEEDQPLPKGMVRNEMGKLVSKAKAAADQKSFVKAMNEQYINRPEVIAKLKAAKLKSMQAIKK
jgi:hypothetical protein